MASRSAIPPYNMRIRGSLPSVEAEDTNLRVLLGVADTDAASTAVTLSLTADCVARGISFAATDELYSGLTSAEPFIAFCTAADVERMRVDARGVYCPTLTARALTSSNLGIHGSTHLYGDLWVDGNVVFSSGISASDDCTFASNVTVSGSLHIGTSTLTHDGVNIGINLEPGEIPTCALHVNGAVFATEQLFALSDRSVKDDIKPITRALDKLNHITGCTYVRIDEHTGARHVGVIAQDVNEAVPEAVQVGRDGKMSVSYGSLVAVTIEGIKELQQMQDVLRTSLHAISATIADVTARAKKKSRAPSRLRFIRRA